MERFESLLMADSCLSAGEQQPLAEEHLPEMVRHSAMNYWSIGDPLVSRGRRILLGVAIYSVADLRLLDALNDILRENAESGTSVDVFSVLGGKQTADFEKYIPGIGNRCDVPLVGIWEAGVMTDRAWGKAGRDLLTRYFPSLSTVRFFDT